MWTRVLFVLLLSALSVFLSALEPSLPSTVSVPAASTASSDSPSATLDRLDLLLNLLEQAANDSQTDSQSLHDLLTKARDTLTTLSSQLVNHGSKRKNCRRHSRYPRSR
jgi:hypothetical protein